MDKPMSMSVKDFLIRTLAVKMMVSEKTIEKVIDHQFLSANQAMDLNDSVEISGFGKFYFNNKKAIKKLDSLKGKILAMQKIIANPETTEQRKKSAQVTIDKAIVSINQLKNRTKYED